MNMLNGIPQSYTDWNKLMEYSYVSCIYQQYVTKQIVFSFA